MKHFLYSPDFYFANSAKLDLTNYKNPKYKYKDNLVYDYIKSKYIIYWNFLNLCISFSLFILCFYFINYKNLLPIDSLFVLFGFITYRVISRAFEIIRAFYIDIIDSKKKNVFINSNQRIVLATKSYFEIFFNFATLNYLAAVLYSHICPLYKKTYPYIFTLFEDNSDKSITLHPLIIFINSFGTITLSNATVDSFFSMLQVLTSLVLVLFALAGYLNNKGDNK